MRGSGPVAGRGSRFFQWKNAASKILRELDLRICKPPSVGASLNRDLKRTFRVIYTGRNFEGEQDMNQKNTMCAEDNRAILLRLFSALRKGNTSAIDEVCSPNFAFHSPNPTGLADWKGRER